MNPVRSLSRDAVIGLGLLAVSSAALAAPPPWSNAGGRRDHGRDEYDYARVIDVDPVYRQVRIETPERECWEETHEVRRGIDGQTAGPTILGAVIGGVVGHQIGSGRGRDAATVAGTVIGGAIGHSTAARSAGPVEERSEHCRTSYHEEWEERIDGYRVTYEYNGREYTTRLPYDPGDKVRVRVAVALAQ